MDEWVTNHIDIYLHVIYPLSPRSSFVQTFGCKIVAHPVLNTLQIDFYTFIQQHWFTFMNWKCHIMIPENSFRLACSLLNYARATSSTEVETSYH